MRNLKGIKFIDKTYEKKIFLMRNSNIFGAVFNRPDSSGGRASPF